MKRWALMSGAECANVVEQADMPTIGGEWLDVTGLAVGRGHRLVGGQWQAPAPVVNTRLTKRAFWSRFPQENLIAMQAILRSGNPALLAGLLGANQLMVSDSPFVDTALQQTINGVNMLASAAFPATITIDGTTLPLRLTAEQAAALLAPPVGDEGFAGVG